ncbi:helix-turn-helix domain-containing protein [Streptomyces olivaceus]|uniref:helix-turn-helix domain-containing protein n=1 Tax=Streptomyces olivaceus TaxID=47716 RepID=UPI001CCF8E50|nr:helix-turn-helix domain-containing protein [Streptomyces olivaceus]MBZ6174362.1 helix-turn-helix domain-containing protein [Streptomyces olivaceus]MBZ6180540.1 helix-turn-helix domain-containing protein [Streptomyces olivaceus]
MSNGNSPEDERPIEDVSEDVSEHAPEGVTEEARPSVGSALQRARVDAGLTVDDITTATRVRIAIVHAIEADDFAPCGGDVYARGHIRTLAKAVGLDPAELVAQFEAENGGRPEPTPSAPLFEAERIRPERRGPNWTAAMVAAIVAVIGFVGFTFVKGGDSGGNEASVAEGSEPSAGASASASASPKKPADPKPDPSDSAIAAAPRDKVTVKVSAIEGRSWISAKDHNGRQLFDGTLAQGASKTFQDNEKVDLVLGDAGAIELYVNGKKIEDDFQPGSVERLTYTKGDPQVG